MQILCVVCEKDLATEQWPCFAGTICQACLDKAEAARLGMTVEEYRHACGW